MVWVFLEGVSQESSDGLHHVPHHVPRCEVHDEMRTTMPLEPSLVFWGLGLCMESELFLAEGVFSVHPIEGDWGWS